MALTRVVAIDRIEVLRDGSLQIRMAKQIVDGDQVVTSEYHRTAFDVGADVEGQMAAVNDHLAQMGWPAVAADSVQQAKAHAAVAWMPDVVANAASMFDAGIAAKRVELGSGAAQVLQAQP